MGAFRRGFTCRNPLVLLVAALLLVPGLSVLANFFAGGYWTLVPLERWMRTVGDSYTYVSWTVGHAKHASPEGPTVYLLGGSAAREAIVSGEALADDVLNLGGPAITAYDLGSNDQNFAESFAVVDNVQDTPAWVLIGLNLGRFTPEKQDSIDGARGRDFLLESPALQRFVADEWGVSTRTTILAGIVAYLTDLAERRGRGLLKGQAMSRGYRQHRYSTRNVPSKSRKERLTEAWLDERYPAFERNRGVNLQVLEALLARSRERGLQVVLVELPLNEAIVRGRFDAAQAEYQRPVRALAKRYGAPYIDFNDQLDLPDADFYDLSHLVEPGRVVWQAELARELARLYHDGTLRETL
ncbi:MAG TPA: SGNH/GDSL hydrolase family protein [Thermoleophilia bacterium]|nr:SGNH/GDSL hydrolase family protein [Thermoleophilia bacterium]